MAIVREACPQHFVSWSIQDDSEVSRTMTAVLALMTRIAMKLYVVVNNPNILPGHCS